MLQFQHPCIFLSHLVTGYFGRGESILNTFYEAFLRPDNRTNNQTGFVDSVSGADSQLRDPSKYSGDVADVEQAIP